MNTITKNKISRIERIRIMNNQQIEYICLIMGWTRIEYCEYQNDQYERFIARYYEDTPDRVNSLRFCAEFRGLFNHQWMNRNMRELIPVMENGLDENRIVLELYPDHIFSLRSEFTFYYHDIHSAKSLYYDLDFKKAVDEFIYKILPYV